MKLLRHIVIVAAALAVCLVLPGFLYADRAGLLSGEMDVTSGATMEIPDQPSGEYVVILHRGKHAAALEQWEDFFLERPVDVIMEDISCLTANGDAAGLQLAQRYQARLAKNQMKLTTENGLLVVSRAENGLYDAVILSREMADAWDYSAVYAREDALVLTVSGVEP